MEVLPWYEIFGEGMPILLALLCLAANYQSGSNCPKFIISVFVYFCTNYNSCQLYDISWIELVKYA